MIVLLVTSHAWADVLFSNLGPGDSFLPGGNLVGATSVGQRRIAVPFQTPPIRQFQFDGFEAPIGGADAIVRASLCIDAAGQPGPAIAHYVQTVGATLTLRRWTSADKPLLEGGTRYWIVTPSIDVRQLVWGSNTIGQRAGGLASVAGGPWSPLDEDRSSPAYRITVVAAVGACCFSTAGACVITQVVDCDAAGGNFDAGIACGPAFCPPAPPRGGCCNPGTSVCTVTTLETCTALGGAWRGDNTSCNLAICPVVLPTGACCLGATCDLSISVFCSIRGGRYLGNGSTCSPVGGVNPCCPADFNNSGEVSVQDLFDFIASYFAGCP
jgi:hypothetical protein